MAQDKTMPPTEAPTATPDAMPGEMAAPTPDMATPAGGKVVVEMEYDVLNSLETLSAELAAAIQAMKANVDAQKGASEAPMAESAPSEVPATAEDEEFLKSLAQEGSMR